MLEKIQESTKILTNTESLAMYNSPENRSARLEQYAKNDIIAKQKGQARQAQAQQNIAQLEKIYREPHQGDLKNRLKFLKTDKQPSRFAKLKDKISSWFTGKEKPTKLDQNKDKIKVKNVVIMLFMYFNALNIGYDIKHSAESNISEYSRNTILEYMQSQGLAAVVRSIGNVDKFGNKN